MQEYCNLKAEKTGSMLRWIATRPEKTQLLSVHDIVKEQLSSDNYGFLS